MAGDGEGFTQLFYILICNFAFYCHFHSAVFISKMIKKKTVFSCALLNSGRDDG